MISNNNASAIASWSVDAGLNGEAPDVLVADYCARLVAAGVPLWRAAFGSDKLHPVIGAQGHHWRAADGVHQELYLRSAPPEQEFEWHHSPWFRMIEDGDTHMRRNLAVGEGTNEFPLLGRLAAEGGSDYFARIIRFGEGARLGETRGVATSWTTTRRDGFGEEDLALIEATLPAFVLALKSSESVETARTLLTTYLGREPSERVLRGEIERGKVNTERKVLWFSDLADFTRIADTLPREQLLHLLNAYADCLVSVVHKHGGEVLKFMGDGILVVFDEADSSACRRALDAAEAARVAIDRLNAERVGEGLPVTGFTLALHEGEVLYGNVGSQERLDFTVVGPSVNEVARIQALSRSLDQPTLVSESFAAACGEERRRLVSVGRYALKGIAQPQELFTIDPTGA